MNKEGFLKELESHLRVLDDKEQQDILDEYAQHIDLKMKSGLSEEEAIRDFGNIGELAADILEAYHVDPRFEERRKGITIRKPDMESVSEGSKKLAGKIGGWLAGMKDSIHHMWEAMRRGGRAFRGTTQEGVLQKKKARAVRGERYFWDTSKRIAWNFCILIWNLTWILITCLLIGLAACCLFGFGILLILVFGGYPLLGAELFCFGAAMSGGALGILTFGLRKKYRKRVPRKETVPVEAEEVE